MTHAGGFLERGSHSLLSALISGPPAVVKAFSFVGGRTGDNNDDGGKSGATNPGAELPISQPGPERATALRASSTSYQEGKSRPCVFLTSYPQMTALCKECGSPVSFVKMPNGKLRPVNIDGSDHFDRCSYLTFQRIKRDGVAFSDAAGEGYEHRGKKHYAHLVGKAIVGAQYVPSCGQCDVPPWVECRCSFGGAA